MNYCMAEQENIWESYKVIIQRLRLYVDNPFVAREGGFADEDNSQLLSSPPHQGQQVAQQRVALDWFKPHRRTIDDSRQIP